MQESLFSTLDQIRGLSSQRYCLVPFSDVNLDFTGGSFFLCVFSSSLDNRL